MTPLTQTDIARLLDTHGADPHRWPADVRIMAELVIEADPASRQLWHQARARDQRVRTLLVPRDEERHTSSALIGRVIAHVAARRQEWVFRPGRRLAAATCMLIVAGFLAGGLFASYEATLDQEPSLIALELAYNDGGVL